MNLTVLQQIVSLINCHMKPKHYYHVDLYDGCEHHYLFSQVDYQGECVKMIHKANLELMHEFLMGYLQCAEECRP